MSSPTIINPAIITTKHINKTPVCHECNDYLVRGQVHHSLIFIKSVRVNIHISRAFCCPECRENWWISGGSDGVMPVNTPDNMPPTVTCLHSNQDDQINCQVCRGSGSYLKAPMYWCSHEPSHQELGHKWDTDLRMIVVEHNPKHGHIRITHGDTLIGVSNELVAEMWRHDCPCFLNDWWSTPITIEEHRVIRSNFEALKRQ